MIRRYARVMTRCISPKPTYTRPPRNNKLLTYIFIRAVHDAQIDDFGGDEYLDYHSGILQVLVNTIGHARINTIGKYQSCMV